MSHPSLFAHRDFRLLLLGQTTSQLGTQVSSVAIPLLAVLTLHASSLEVGIINASSTIAFALIGLQAGAWLDRMHRRGILIASDLARAILLATIPIAAWFGVLTILQLVIVSLLVGVARVFFDVGYQSYIPSVVGKDRVLAGNSSMEFVRASGQVAGPGLGGVLVGLLGAANVVLVQAVTFALSAWTLVAIRTREEAIPVPERRPSMRSQIVEGLRFVVHNRILRATAIASAAINFSFAIASAVNVIFMSRILNLPAAGIGLVIAVGSVTVMAGAALTPRFARWVGSARIVWVSLAVTAPLSVLGAFAQPGWGVLLLVAGIAAGEFGQIVYSITNVSLRQQLCPDELLGRVNATMRVLIMFLFPLGAIVGGVLGELIGARETVLLSGVLLVLCPVVLFLALRGVRDVEDVPAWERPAA
ncbi:transmembrane secretion effector [Diaminobutyricimonas aerilata]|uniref:Transmembrane secretion effector n=1 Tax=Diaminobutyricimonas aerilata TaxID=1162967 RepID=A0A2M9CNX8_9MICO|nr:MFS transporter [Diaminobutyricimonas aerilata]PJJ73584.1 transmembrane secretion effector [Diaminobutyricimonas aerilata]